MDFKFVTQNKQKIVNYWNLKVESDASALNDEWIGDDET